MRYAKSQAWLDRARRVTPGASQTRSKAPQQFVEGAFPAFTHHGRGAHLWDLDGHKYVDWICALGAVGLGYANDRVNAAVVEQLAGGASFSLPHRLEATTAEVILEHVAPWAEQVRFVKTGSEATEAAMRIARVATGRDLVVSVGYHGWHSVHDAAKDVRPGVPWGYVPTIRDAPYNDPTEIHDALDADHGTDSFGVVAAVILEPVLIDAPKPGYLEGVRELCTRYGALLIFDEMVTGFRWALGGASEYFGITPDLACYGKAMGNGLPIACVAGPELLMRHATYASSTFGGDTLALAAASATIQEYVRTNAVETMWKYGAEFQDRVACLLDDVPLALDGYPVHPRIKATTGDAEQDRLVMSVFLQETAAHGALFHHAGFNVSAALTPADLGKSVLAAHRAVETIRAAKGDYKSVLRGQPIRPLFQRVP